MGRTGSTASNECAFKNILKTCPNGEKKIAPKSLPAHQVAVIIESSNKRCDVFAGDMKNSSKNNSKYHSSCYSTYTSSTKIEQYITTKRKSEDRQSTIITSPSTRRLRSR